MRWLTSSLVKRAFQLNLAMHFLLLVGSFTDQFPTHHELLSDGKSTVECTNTAQVNVLWQFSPLKIVPCSVIAPLSSNSSSTGLTWRWGSWDCLVPPSEAALKGLQGFRASAISWCWELTTRSVKVPILKVLQEFPTALHFKEAEGLCTLPKLWKNL